MSYNHEHMKTILAIGLLIAALGTPSRAETFVIDPAHSTLSFKIKGPIGHVNGKFEKFGGEFNYVPDQPRQWSANATIDAASIATGIHKRDAHLQTGDFLDVNRFGVITFVSTGAVAGAAGKTELQGSLTMHGVTLPVVLTLESVTVDKDSSGKDVAHASATAHLDRKDYGVGASYGFFTVGKTVDIVLDIQGTPKQTP
jgi:polyisoprenoid-binding protein YceI